MTLVLTKLANVDVQKKLLGVMQLEELLPTVGTGDYAIALPAALAQAFVIRIKFLSAYMSTFVY